MDSTQIKIGYFADGPWSHSALDLLTADQRLEISFICARFRTPDRHLRDKAKALGIKFYISENVNSQDFLNTISPYKCDLFVSMSFDQILRKNLFSLPHLGTINCHAGKLPFYRGRNILNWALINDEKEFGITVHYVDQGIDTGDIILQRTYPISDNDDYNSLLNKAYLECPSVLYEAIKLTISGNVQRVPQKEIHPYGSIFCQRKLGDELIDWRWTSREIFNFTRALTYPGPMAQSMLGKSLVRIVKIELIDGAPKYKCLPGVVLAKDEKGFLVKTGDSYLRIVEWQSEVRLFVGGRFN